MAIWSDIAKWVGPTVNRNAGGTVETRGVVVHIAEGTYEGTISWQKNPSAEVSSHFIVDRNGTIAQMVDTADKAWTQKAGNGHWISVECAGFSTGSQYHTPGSEKLTDAQVAAVARILAKAHQVYGVPLQLATSPSGKGLGHHSMGGTAWGHLDCPGDPIIAQKPAILAAATGGDDMAGLTTAEEWRLWDANNVAQCLAEMLDPISTYDDTGKQKNIPNKLAQVLLDIQKKIAAPAPVALTDAQLQTIVAGVTAQLGGKLDQILARLAAAGDALDG